MSQSPTDAKDQASLDRYLQNWNELGLMIARGGSFSGKERNCCFLNTRGSRFADVSAATGLDLVDDGRGLALVDWDHDGDLDLWLANRTSPRVRFMRNDMATGNHFLALQLTGVTANRDAIGARVELFLQGSPQPLLQTLRAGEGFLSQSSKWIHFGLGDHAQIDRLIIHWPTSSTSGAPDVEVFTDLQLDHRYAVTQGMGRLVEGPSRTQAVTLAASIAAPRPTTDMARTVLLRRRPLTGGNYRDLHGADHPLPIGTHPTWINLWGSTCPPCLAELQEFAQHASEWEQQGVKIVALCTDLWQADPDFELAGAKQFAMHAKLPFAVGVAPESLLQQLSTIHNEVYYAQRQLPLPSSFLVDRSGQIAVIYKGPVTSSQVLADLKLLDKNAEQLLAETLPFPGSRLLKTFDPSPLAMAEAYREGGYLDEAKTAATKYLAEVSATNNLDEMAAALSGALRPPVTPEQTAAPAGTSSPAVAHDAGESMSIREQLKKAQLREQIRIAELLARIEHDRGDLASEAVALRDLLKLQPDRVSAHVALATSLIQQRLSKEATAQLDAVERLDSISPSQHATIGRLRMQLGDANAAVRHLQQAIDAAPNEPQAYLDLAIVWQMRGRMDDAIGVYHALLKQQPDLYEALNNLAWIRATAVDAKWRNGTEAVEVARHLCELTKHQAPPFLDTLAAALAEAGDFVAAQQIVTAAIELATRQGDQVLTEKLQKRRRLYETHQPYRDQP